MNVNAKDLDFEDMISPMPKIGKQLFVEDLEVIAEKVPEQKYMSQTKPSMAATRSSKSKSFMVSKDDGQSADLSRNGQLGSISPMKRPHMTQSITNQTTSYSNT